MSAVNCHRLCALGDTTRRLWELFASQSGATGQGEGRGGALNELNIRPMLNSLHLFPTRSQVCEVVHCACEMAGRVPGDHLTFGEFAIFVTELQELYRRQRVSGAAGLRRPRSQLTVKAAHALLERRLSRRFSGRGEGFQVFLGGSCNPTTWRNDIAIPFFKQHNITYYNPQVLSWHPELMEIEDQAKQTAEILFFVIDNQTRSVASIIEAAYLAGCGRKLILVIKQFDKQVIVAGEPIRTAELEDLERSHAYLTDLVERMSIPVFTDVHKALECTKRVLEMNISVSDLAPEDGYQPVKYPHLRVANELIRVRESFTAVDTSGCGMLNCNDVCLAYKTLTHNDLPQDAVEVAKNATYTFDDFCCLVSEHRYHSHNANLLQQISAGLYWFAALLLNWWRGELESVQSEPRPRDVYLGGTCGKSSWRDDVAIPVLLKNGVSFYNPQLQDGWNECFIPHEVSMKEACRLLVFVITDDTRAVTSMLEAAHYIGRGCNVVLCIQNVKYSSSVDTEMSSQSAVDDYNRARAYLSDIANRDGIPVLSDITEAIACVLKQLQD